MPNPAQKLLVRAETASDANYPGALLAAGGLYSRAKRAGHELAVHLGESSASRSVRSGGGLPSTRAGRAQKASLSDWRAGLGSRALSGEARQ